MGFSPGDFINKNGTQVHWEGKAHSIVLWNDDESEAILSLDVTSARKALDQLSLLVDMLESKGL